MDQNGVLVSDVMLELADCLQKRLALDIADGSADLNDGNTLLVYFFSAVETALDFVCNVRNDLYGASAEITVAFFLQNRLPALYTFWLCEARPEWTDTCRLFLLEGQRKSFEYIKNSRDKGAYECMQRFTSYIMNSYIELDGGIPFRHYYEKFARSLFNEEFDLIRLPRCGNRFRRTRLHLQQKFCRYARRSPLQRRPYVQPGSRTALCFQDFLPSSHQQNNTLMRIT